MRSNVFATLTILFPLVAALTGCFPAIAPQQKFDKDANASIKRISIVEIPDPAEYAIFNIGGAGYAFGVVGVLAQEADRKNKTSEFTRQMKEQQLAAGSQLTQTLRAELMKQGYTVTLVPSDRRASAPENGIPDYSHMSADTDAVLDVRLGLVGYVAPADSPNYVPFIRADAQLLSTKSKFQVYFKALSFGIYIDHQSENIELIAPASKEYAYGDFPELMKNAKAAQKGLDSGVGVIAARIVQDLTGAPAPGPFDPKACELERDYARRAATTQGEASAQLKRLSERKAAQCKAQQGAAPGH